MKKLIKKRAASAVNPKYYTVHVRFPRGLNIAKLYTYRVAKGKKLKLGDEVVADTAGGPSVAYIVSIHSTPMDNDETLNYKFLTRKSVPL